MNVTARSHPNIALIKYWGNRDEALRLPMADSLSMTLDSPSVEVSAEPADELAVRSYETDGAERVLTGKQLERIATHLELTRRYLKKLKIGGFPKALALTIRSGIPPGIGIASSAAVFSCLAEAYAGLVTERPLTRREVSVIGRLGSGSASRSAFGGFSAMVAGKRKAVDAAYAEQIAPADHWPLCDVIIVPSLEEKTHGSTEGHALAGTSPLFADRIAAIPRRQRECTEAILQKDFEKLQHVAEEDALDMHRVMETSMPPLRYLSEATHRIVAEAIAFRTAQHLPVLYTMDAGPTVHLICDAEFRQVIRAFADSQEGCTVFEAGIGPGSRLL
jgi:diphosphomevalonate decarboxylase